MSASRPSGRTALGRRGLMYTIVVIFILFIIANIFFTQSRLHERGDAATQRVRTIDRFIDDLEQDSERAAYIAGFRTLIAMEQHITTTGKPIPRTNVSVVFREIFLTGRYGTSGFAIMEDATFNEYLGRVEQEAAKQGIIFDGTVTDIALWQTDPWYVLVNYTLVANITDARGTANWTITRTFAGRVPVTDLRDPLFTAGTYGRIQRVIKRANTTDFTAGNDTSGIKQHLNGSQYIAAGRGPDMIMRFSGDLNDSAFGIESLVDIDELAAQNLEVDTEVAIVDYKYFNRTAATVCGIQNLSAKYRFTSDDLAVYDLEDLESGGCP